MATRDPLARYQAKRDFARTPEPAGEVGAVGEQLAFVIQKHAARSLHYDFRLELDGTLKSWAVPKGPSLDPHDKRMAVQVEDHPLSYADFEGTIPPGQYGAGTVIVWDQGRWIPHGDARRGLRDGKLEFELEGVKLQGRWALVRMRSKADDRQPAWLLIKQDDAFARAGNGYSVVDALPDSVRQVPARAPRGSRAAAVAPPARAPAKGDAKPVKSAKAGAGSRAARLPATLAPQLATLVDEAPREGDWLYEIKFDGYRLLTRVDGDNVRCITRNGHDWSSRLPALVTACRALHLRNGWLDGEIVVLGKDGQPDFQALQNAFDSARTAQVLYFLFDLPFVDGEDLRGQPLQHRRDRLAALLAQAPSEGPLRLSATLDADPVRLLKSAREAGLEGLIGKRGGSAYTSSRSRDWIKLKTRKRQEFVIGGYTDPQGSRSGLGSLLLGLHDAHGQLHYAGSVGSGFDEATLADLAQRLQRLHVDVSPFVDAPARVGTTRRQAPHWVRPRLLAEVSFAQWTADRRVRHAVFHGLRSDKKPVAITAELPRALPAAAPSAARATAPAAPRITHGERVIDKGSGLTKGDLCAYYARVAPLILPHLKARPVALLRAPRGVDQRGFFQKHADPGELPGVDLLDPSLDPDHEPLLAVQSAAALLTVAQMNVIELHTWNATARAIDKPDRMVFDLDPGEGVSWPQVQQAAHLLHALLDELGLVAFLKTSGGKGLHIVLPLRPRLPWEAVKDCSQAIVEHMARVLPQTFVAKSGPRNRVGRIYIDYLRNGFGATTAAAWSARARPGLPVSVPLAWDELASVDSGSRWTVSNVHEREAVGNHPWSGYEDARQTLTQAMKRLAKAAAAAPG